MSPSTQSSFSVLASPDTDIWRKPPSTDVQSAPLHSLTSPISLAKFSSARISLQADWVERYDQGGLYLELRSTSPTSATTQSRWLKTGIEYYQGAPFISTVGTDKWSDWSVFPLDSVGGPEAKGVTLEVRREGDELGKSLWCYALKLDDNGKEVKRAPLREVNWFFAEEDDVVMSISAYAARPAKVDGKLEVKFEGGEVELVK